MFEEGRAARRFSVSALVIAVFLAFAVGAASSYFIVQNYAMPWDTSTSAKVVSSTQNTKSAELPFDLQEHTLRNMAVGETAYTMPWAMWVDKSRHAWLHPDYPAEGEEMGTVSMQVWRTARGYAVQVPLGEKYSLDADPGYVGEVDGFLRVVSIRN